MPVIIPVEADDRSFREAMAGLQSSVEKSSAVISKALEGMAKKSTKAVDELSESEKEAAKQADEASKGLEDLGDAAGLPVDQLKKLSEGFGAALSSMTSAQLGMVAFGGAAIAGIAALTAVAASAYALVDGIVSLTRASAEAIPSLQALEEASGLELLPAETVDRVQQADAALDAVGASASLTGAILSGQLAPYVDQVATLLVAANLALADFLQANTQILDVLVQVGEGLVNNLMAPIKGAILLLGGFLSGVADLAETFESDLADSISSVADELLLFGATDFAANVDSMTQALGQYVPMAQKLVTGQRKVNAEQKEGADTTDKLRDTLYELQMLVAEGQLAPGLKDIRNASGAMVDLNADLRGVLTTYGVTVEKAKDLDQALVDLRLQAIDLDTAFSRGEITQAEYAQGQADNKAAVEATTLAIQKQADAAKKAQANALSQTIGQLQGGLEGIATLIGGPVAGAITGLILNLKDTVAGLTEQLLSLPQILKDAPALLTGFIVTLVETVVPALMNAAPDIAYALAMAVTDPEFLKALVKMNLMIFNPVTGLKVGVEIAKGLWEAFLDGWAYFASGAMVEDFKAALMQGMRDAVQYLRDAWAQLVQALRDVFTLGGESGTAGKVGDALREVFTLGRADTQYGDAPGMVRAGPQGQTVQTSPGDYTLVGRSKQDLLRRALDGAGVAQPSAPQFAPVLAMQDMHRGFDGFFVRHARLGGQVTQVLRDGYRTGRG